MHNAVTMASITSDVGSIFHPLFWLFAQALAFFFSLIPNYIIAITLLTVLVMILTAPLTVKSVKSMMEMQRIQPEFKKLQAKYKGDREKLNEEVMKLYREHGVSPIGGCLPLLLQMPFFVCLYGVIKGLVNAVTINHKRIPQPRYLTHSSLMYKDIIKANGQIKSFGIDLSQTPFQHHGSFGVSLPYWVLFFAAIALQYLQMSRLNKRNAANGVNNANNPQMQTMQTMQKVTPLIFGVIYIAFPIGVTVYFIVSSACRILIQEILFRAGVTKVKAVAEGATRELPAKRRRTVMDRLADAQANARQAQLQPGSIEAESRDSTPKPSGGQKAIGGNAAPTSNGNGNSAIPNGKTANTNGSAAGGNGSEPKPKQTPARSKDKRPRKAR
jgi:YidC/Oxa1 family membrane protein insertase